MGIKEIFSKKVILLYRLCYFVVKIIFKYCNKFFINPNTTSKFNILITLSLNYRMNNQQKNSNQIKIDPFGQIFYSN